MEINRNLLHLLKIAWHKQRLFIFGTILIAGSWLSEKVLSENIKERKDEMTVGMNDYWRLESDAIESDWNYIHALLQNRKIRPEEQLWPNSSMDSTFYKDRLLACDEQELLDHTLKDIAERVVRYGTDSLNDYDYELNNRIEAIAKPYRMKQWQVLENMLRVVKLDLTNHNIDFKSWFALENRRLDRWLNFYRWCVVICTILGAALVNAARAKEYLEHQAASSSARVGP